MYTTQSFGKIQVKVSKKYDNMMTNRVIMQRLLLAASYEVNMAIISKKVVKKLE